MLVANKTSLKEAATYLAGQDPVLAPIIAHVGVCTITPHKNYYWELIDSIISQQLSVKAATSIENRFKALFTSDHPTPEAILEVSVDTIQSAGLSRPKATYIRDLAQHILDGKLKFDLFDTLDNQEIIQELVAVKGVGEWTAHMFLIFCMGRLDVLATGDLGIRNGIRTLYALPIVPTPSQVSEIAETNAWHPYESVACWYVWQSLDNMPAV